ncbi:hypothetical protein C8R44DRAFT_866155 [Mycena epipterygia]|nr:hypothetical protein C8R44DRAFT_866155 [Mycena epipterygia]
MERSSPGLRSLSRRDPFSDAETQCASSSNTNESCYPVALTAFVQGQDASFVWNPTLAQFRKTNRVNITIYDGADEWDGSRSPANTILRYTNIVNPASGAGLLTVKVNDSWWGDKGAIWAGNISYQFFWTIWGADEQDTVTAGGQPFFAAIQTALPDSIRATMLSTQAAPTSSTNNTCTSSNGSSSSRTPIIGGVVGSLAGLTILLALLFLIRRRRLAQRRISNTHIDPIQPTPHYEKQPHRMSPPSKSALDFEMRMAHERLEELQYELHGNPERDSSQIGTQVSSENVELRRRIAQLTAEVGRLRSMGAEAPPAYTVQE